MPRRHVEGLEVVEIVFEFGAVRDVKTEAREDLLHALEGARQRVQTTDGGVTPRQGDVHHVIFQGRPAPLLLERRTPLRNAVLETPFEGVQRLAAGAALRRRGLADGLQLGGGAPFLPR